MKRVALLAGGIAGTLLACGSAAGRPTGVICPGGVPAAEDTLIFEYPVIGSPALLSLRAPSLLAPGTGIAASADSAMSTVRGGAAGTGAFAGVPVSTPATPTPAPGTVTSSQASLLFSGSKSLAVEMGRGRDASLHQTLDLTVRGRVAGDVEVAAVPKTRFSASRISAASCQGRTSCCGIG